MQGTGQHFESANCEVLVVQKYTALQAQGATLGKPIRNCCKPCSRRCWLALTAPRPGIQPYAELRATV